MTAEEATIQINEMTFPEVSEGDVASYDEYTFVYQSGEWVIKQE